MLRGTRESTGHTQDKWPKSYNILPNVCVTELLQLGCVFIHTTDVSATALLLPALSFCIEFALWPLIHNQFGIIHCWWVVQKRKLTGCTQNYLKIYNYYIKYMSVMSVTYSPDIEAAVKGVSYVMLLVWYEYVIDLRLQLQMYVLYSVYMF